MVFNCFFNNKIDIIVWFEDFLNFLFGVYVLEVDAL